MKITVLLIALFLGSCAVGPKFRSPQPNLPATFSHTSDTLQPENLSKWWQHFNDPVLDSLMERALKGNKNLASAVQNIEIARLKIKSVRSQALPSIGISASAGAKYTYDTKIVQSYSAMPTISWEIDLWGKIRKQIEAAGASYSATEYETAAILQTLCSEVATTYFSALSYKKALEIARQTYLSRTNSQILMDSMYFYGSISEVQLKQSQASLATAGATVQQYERALEQSILAMNLLLGENPNKIELGDFREVLLTIPAGVPSSLLERRPDVMQAYYLLKQANAMIGVAIANRLPSISLTGEGGFLTTIAQGASTGKPISWSAAASFLAPILNWGTLRRNQEIARIETSQALLAYENSVIGAINDVEQSLVAVDTYGKEVVQSIEMVNSSKIAAQLTSELFRAGSASYLDLLDADRTLFSAQLQYVETVNNQVLSYISLYKALGGGW